MTKQTSENVESLAGRILQGGNPFEEAKMRFDIQKAIMEHADVSSPSGISKLRVPDKVVEEIAILLKPFIDDVLSLAGSLVSQGDGRG